MGNLNAFTQTTPAGLSVPSGWINMLGCIAVGIPVGFFVKK